MNEKKYKKRLDFQNNMISKQSEQIATLKSKIENLELKLKEKNEQLFYVESLRKELTDNVKEYKRLKNEYGDLIGELKKMKKIINQEVYKGRWWLVRWLIK